jgi:hypothetical protein
MMERTDQGPDYFDTLSAIWILACNDENPIITYRGLTYRMGLPESFGVRSMVLGRRELFRAGVVRSRMDAWKKRMKQGASLPVWISETASAQEREAEIDDLTPDDVFRSQFRIEDGAPKSPIEIIDWGLAHIERLRKASVERREEVNKRRANLATFLSLGVAALAVVTSAAIQIKSIGDQSKLKEFEVTFRTKQDGYSTFMSSYLEAADAASGRDRARTLVSLNRMEAAYYALVPFLARDVRIDLLAKTAEFRALCGDLLKSPVDAAAAEAGSDRHKELERVAQLKSVFMTRLHEDLFERW